MTLPQWLSVILQKFMPIRWLNPMLLKIMAGDSLFCPSDYHVSCGRGHKSLCPLRVIPEIFEKYYHTN